MKKKSSEAEDLKPKLLNEKNKNTNWFELRLDLFDFQKKFWLKVKFIST